MLRPSPPQLSALVRLVHNHCGLGAAAAKYSPDPRWLTADCVGDITIDALPEAIRGNRPCVLRRQGDDGAKALVPEDVVGKADTSSDLLQRLRDLCGSREVRVRLPREAGSGGSSSSYSAPSTSSASSSSSSSAGPQSSKPAFMFGDPLNRSPYKRAETRRLRDVVDVLRRQAAGEEVSIYAANVPLEPILPEFWALLRPIQENIAKVTGRKLGEQIPGTPVLYLGAGSQQTPLHFDPTENLTIVLQGSKKFRLFPPSASEQLEPQGGMFAAAICWTAGIIPAIYSNFDAWNAPLERRPAAADVTLNAGEVLYLPPGWWHAVQGSAEPNVTVVFGYAGSTVKRS